MPVGLWFGERVAEVLRLAGVRTQKHLTWSATDISADRMHSLFSLDEWIDDATALIDAMNVALKSTNRDSNRDQVTERITHEFALSIAVVRHLQLDPQLPVELIADHWPGHPLRSTYRRFDDAFKRRMYSAFR